MIGLVAGDDERIIRQAMTTINWSSIGVELLGIGTNGLEVLELVKELEPKIVLTDIRMPGINGIELTKTLKKERPEIKIVFLTGYQEFEMAHEAIKLGAVGFILKPSSPEEILDAVNNAKILIESKHDREHNEQKINKQLKECQLALQNKFIPDTAVTNSAIQKVIKYIKTNYNKDITLEMVAKTVFLNHIYLSRLIKKETGDTFLNILTRVRMEKACELLHDCDTQIYDVAYSVGVKDARYFGQIFKKHFGITPTEFRKRIGKTDNGCV